MNYLEKLLSIVVPCYNSQDYIDRCVESLLPGNDRVEILLIDDGSTDRTAEIIDKYERTYPKQVKAVHQENGGHGQAINTGMYLAKGKYVKVVDSDDWLDLNSYQKVLNFLESLEESNEEIDMLICNYIYDKVAMETNYSLEPDELAAGYVLSCQALPLTSDVVVDFDAKGMA